MMDIKGFTSKNLLCLHGQRLLATSDKSASSSAVKIENITRQKLPEELHKPIIRKFENRKVDS